MTAVALPAADGGAAARRAATAAVCGDLVGATQQLLDMSVEYAKVRVQFGRAIGSYQAIKHKLADVHIAVELARPLIFGAAISLGAESAESADTARDVSAAKAAASDAA